MYKTKVFNARRRENTFDVPSFPEEDTIRLSDQSQKQLHRRENRLRPKESSSQGWTI